MSESIVNAAVWLILALPLLAAGLIALVSIWPLPEERQPASGSAAGDHGGHPPGHHASEQSWLGRHAHWLSIAALGVACGSALFVLLVRAGVLPGDAVAQSAGFEWLQVGEFDISISVRADTLTAMMLATVTFVGLLVAVYSAGYMHGDPGYPRYFAAFSLFVFSMCLLVAADNFVLLYVAWELVGLCSYLLIGFWFERPAAAAAARKAFVVNRVGDLGFLMGLLLIWTTFGTLRFEGVLRDAVALEINAAALPAVVTIICLLLFAGAMGKSAQFPLHVWLPDAMEGPTPASALIHAATMVTAGVYLVARSMPLFVYSPEAQVVVACVGSLTALLAALIATGQHDLKRVLAWSTVSQLGLMFVALGAAASDAGLAAMAVGAAMFHLLTHAFFKALLFLGAGSVMHAMGNITDMRRFGGLRTILPRTHVTFLCGAAALAGVPLLSGFWSKDEIIAVVSEASHTGPWAGLFQALLASALATSALTAFYTCRIYLRTFWGSTILPAEAGHHAHESPPNMTVPLTILAVLAVVAGVTLGPTGLFAEYLHGDGHGGHGVHWDAMAWSTLAAVLGIGAAVLWTKGSRPAADRPRSAWAVLLENRLYLDEILAGIAVLPLRIAGAAMLVFDRRVIDSLIDAIARLPSLAGRMLRPLHGGLIQAYALVMLAGLAAIVLAVVVSG